MLEALTVFDNYVDYDTMLAEHEIQLEHQFLIILENLENNEDEEHE